MAERTRDYALCGWRVSSEIDLPELPRLAAAPGEADIAIVLGDVPDQLDATFRTPTLQIDAAGIALYRFSNVGAFLIEGSRVTIAPLLPHDAPDIRLFLLGSVFGILCHQRGLLPVHAATVEIDGKAVGFAGGSGAGKSTLAAAFRRRGFTLLADDVTPLALETMQVMPGVRRIRLWSDSAKAADWPEGELERCRLVIDKYSRDFDDGFVTAPLAPQALFHLSRLHNTEGSVLINRLHGTAALAQLSRQTYRRRSLVALAGRAEAMARWARAAAGIPRHFELRRQFGYDQLDATIDAIVDTVRASQ